MNFKQAFLQGKAGKNFGLPTGLDPLDRAIDGIQRSSIYGVAAGPKVGKTTLVDFSFVINPFLYALDNPDLEIDWDYFSYEINRVRKEFDFAAHFMYRDYGIFSFKYEGETYQMSPRYLLGKLKCKNNNDKLVPISAEHEKMLHEIYQERIIPLFGEYSDKGMLIKKGFINFYDWRDNPTGIRNTLLQKAKKQGSFIEKTFTYSGQKSVSKIVGYKALNPDAFHIKILDHYRKMKRERGYTMKENVDKMIEYQVELRNICGYTFVGIIHLNRSMADVQRLKYAGSQVYPTGEDVKGTGNLSEECNYLLTMMNPTDPKWGLETHFDVEVNNYPNLRSIHLVESRDTECPQHLPVRMFGNIKYFKQL